MQIQLSDHFTYKKLLRFTIPSIIMMFFANLFNVIDDGFFVSNFVGKDAFVALNIMSPIFTVFMSVSYMLGAGGNAYISKLLGEGKDEKAASVFSSLVYFSIILTLVISAICIPLVKPYFFLPVPPQDKSVSSPVSVCAGAQIAPLFPHSLVLRFA